MNILISSNFSVHLLPRKNIARKLQCAKIHGGWIPHNIISLQANFIETIFGRRCFLRICCFIFRSSYQRGYFIGNKAQRRISKRTEQENKARQIFRKLAFLTTWYAHVRTWRALFSRTCAYKGLRNVGFSKNLACFVFLLSPFWDSPFCHFTTSD